MIEVWSPRADLNRRPHPYQGCALPTELQGPVLTKKILDSIGQKERPGV